MFSCFHLTRRIWREKKQETTNVLSIFEYGMFTYVTHSKIHTLLLLFVHVWLCGVVKTVNTCVQILQHCAMLKFA